MFRFKSLRFFVFTWTLTNSKVFNDFCWLHFKTRTLEVLTKWDCLNISYCFMVVKKSAVNKERIDYRFFRNINKLCAMQTFISRQNKLRQKKNTHFHPITSHYDFKNSPKYSPSSSRFSISSSICLVISSIFLSASVGPLGFGGVTLYGKRFFPPIFNLPPLELLQVLGVGLTVGGGLGGSGYTKRYQNHTTHSGFIRFPSG